MTLDPEDLEARRISDVSATGATLVELVEELLAQGVELDDLEGEDDLLAFGAERLLRPEGPRVDLARAAELLGSTTSDLTRLWLSLGVPLDGMDDINEPELDGLRLMLEARELMGDEPVRQLARVVGISTRRMSEALGSTFRLNYELPAADAGLSRAELMAGAGWFVTQLFPRYLAMIDALHRRQLASVGRTRWGPDASHSAAIENLTVGFADLVGFTARTETATAAEIMGAQSSFEAQTVDHILEHGGRVVKLIGDEVMFVIDDSAEAVAVARHLVGIIEADPSLPSLRVGLATGPLVVAYGDYYGPVVNLAARLVGVATPGSVAIAAAEVPDGVPIADLVLHQLAGIQVPVEVATVGP